MEDLKVINVRAMIDLFEDNCKNETAQLLNRSLSKSFGGLSLSERKYKSKSPNDPDILFHLNQRLTSLCYKLKDYKIYAKEIHVALQEELIETMTILIDMDIKNNTLMYRKKEVMYDIKACFNELSRRLPGPSDNVSHGFGDFSYKPFTWKRPNSVAGVGPNARDSSNNRDTSKDFTSLSTRVVKPQRTQSVIERYAKSFQEPSINESNKSYSSRSGRVDLESLRSTDLVTNSVNQSPDLYIGGADGIRRSVNSSDIERMESLTSPSNEGVVYEPLTSPSSFRKSFDLIMGGETGIRRPVNSSHIDKTTVIASARSDDVSLKAKNLQRSSSEISEDHVIKRPVLIGRSESAKLWTYGELRGRRRPVSLGGTVVTLNSPKDIISSLTFSHDYSQSSGRILDHRVQDDSLQNRNQETVYTEIQESNHRPEDENSLQSVQILKKIFELKSDETENQERQKSFNDQEDQTGDFREYVQSIQKSVHAGGYKSDNLAREDSNDDSSTNTIVELEVEGDEIVECKRVGFSRTSSVQVDEVEGLDTYGLRHGEEKEVDEIIITSSVSEDLEEVASFSSEKSIYLDPVD